MRYLLKQEEAKHRTTLKTHKTFNASLSTYLSLFLLLALSSQSFFRLASAQSSNTQQSTNQDTSSQDALYISSIDPDRGPTYGDTRVLVRGGNFDDRNLTHPYPKCKFNNSIVNATYVFCTKDVLLIDDPEAHRQDKVFTCLQCENSPPSNNPDSMDKTSFTISLTGDFSENAKPVVFTYYPQAEITQIIPPYGPKDGKTIVTIYGKNFLDYGDHTRCAFGTKSIVARYISSTHMECDSTFSDVVNRPIPFAVSLNNQQFSRSNVSYWYYNWPSISELVPSKGPWFGGTNITLKGRNFKPFNDAEIDNTLDRVCVFDFNKNVDQKNFRIFKNDNRYVFKKAYIESSTIAYCESPPMVDDIYTAFVEITLNNQDYSDDSKIFEYYLIPQLFDINPREGPVSGGTRIIAIGTNFTDQGNVTFNFTKRNESGTWTNIVKAKVLNTGEIEGFSPPVDMPGYWELSVSLQTGVYSLPVKYLYYEMPIIYSIYPTCGPDYGYTQITVLGKNFWDLGENKVLCVFNKTIFTNATIMEPDILKCDSPTLYNSQGYSTMGKDQHIFYYLEVTIDGGNYIGGPKQVFTYYKDPAHVSIVPDSGPIRGGTLVKVSSQGGFNQWGVCNKTTRLATWEVKPHNETNDTFMFVSTPAVSVPDPVVVGVALNGQQFTRDLVLHVKDDENTFEYYVDPFITSYTPKAGPSVGGTRMKISGFGFTPRKDKEGNVDKDKNKMYIRFVDPDTHQELAPAKQIDPQELNDDELFWRTPALPSGTKALMQISLNDQDWQNVVQPQKPYSFIYYESPHIDVLHPAFGPVKAAVQKHLYIEGRNFKCPDANCSNLNVRFMDAHNNTINVKGEWMNETYVRCLIPKYTKPDELVVELTLNGQDFTNDGKKYGYFDPYVLNAEPRLISVEGTTKVKIKGFGFVDSKQTKSAQTSGGMTNNQINCGGKPCIKDAQFIDKNTILTNTFPQTVMNYNNGQNILWDPINLDASVYEDDFTDNQVQIWYYQEPDYQGITPDETPANVESQIFVKTDFKGNNMDRLNKYANFTCRFMSAEGKVKYTKGYMIKYPLDQANHGTPNNIQCKSPIWDLGDKEHENVKLDIAVNGQDFKGGFDFVFHQELKLHRVLPMSGPVQGNTTTKLFGLGFRPPKYPVNAKWGVFTTLEIIREQVKWCYYRAHADYSFSEEDCERELKTEIYDDSRFPFMADGKNFTTIFQNSTTVWGWNRTQGGPYFVEVGKNTQIQYMTQVNQSVYEGNITINGSSVAQYSYIQVPQVNTWTYYDYERNSVYYYFYKDCVIKDMFPHSALLKGGTMIQVSGAWFKDMPWHGVVPHCRFGDKIVRGFFDSTVRIACMAPPGKEVGQEMPFEVSLNGVDWSNTGYKFSYYDPPLLDHITPTSGKESGGTPIYIAGKTNFTRMNESSEFNCKFTPLNLPMPPKIVPAIYINESYIMCQSVGGWGKGDEMRVQVTFNGFDYDDNNFTFTVFSVNKIYPRSGPYDTQYDEDIIIEGAGFREDMMPRCQLNGTVYNASNFTWNTIRCPIHKANATEGRVPFAVAPNGEDWTEIQGGFYFYSQPLIYRVEPHQGPSQGKGIITFHGVGLQNNSNLQDPQCRVGNAFGKPVYISNEIFQCVVENIELPNEGETLPAQVALNNYSWTDLNERTYYIPYGIDFISPNSGPVGSYIDVYVYGKGFQQITDEQYSTEPRCRFGSPDNNAVVDAQIISYDKLLCRLQADFQMIEQIKFPVDIPFAVALSSNDSNSPWTETSHKFRLYNYPVLIASDPTEVEIGTSTDVLVYADESGGNFFDPVPVNNSGFYQNPIMCKFGRFGESEAVFINEKVIKCRTPTIEDDPSSVYREEVLLSVAQNGKDFDEYNTQVYFTFIGTGTYLVFWQILIVILLIALIIAALIVCIHTLYQKMSAEDQQRYGAGHEGQAHTFNIGGGLMVPRGRADWNAERSSVDIIEKASGGGL